MTYIIVMIWLGIMLYIIEDALFTVSGIIIFMICFGRVLHMIIDINKGDKSDT